MQTGIERFVEDQYRTINLDDYYVPYPKQAEFHRSPAPFRLLGGAAGPGKTLALIMEHLIACNEFSDPDQAKQVHTLLLRRTFPRLQATVITRFLEKVPKELYSSFTHGHPAVVTWLNGSSTHFGSMHYDEDAWSYQGQWFKIGYDEASEFTFKQWSRTAAWNRCPVSPYCTKDAATNPIGPGAGFLKQLFIDRVPCDEMDEAQRRQYRGSDYAFFPCTYLDNPIYANDVAFIRQLESYPAAIRDALKEGKWGLVGGYFTGAWDPGANTYEADSVEIKPWFPKWIGGDWGFEHNSAIYWYCIDDSGVTRIYREMVCNHHTPEQLGERIASLCIDAEGKQESYEGFPFSHDAFGERTDANTIALRVSDAMAKAGVPVVLSKASRDKQGRETLFYQELAARVKIGERFNDVESRTEPILRARLQISDACPKLIAKIPFEPRDEDKPEQIEEHLGDDEIQGATYGLHWRFGGQAVKPLDVIRSEVLKRTLESTQDMTAVHMANLRFEQDNKAKFGPLVRPTRWRRK